MKTNLIIISLLFILTGCVTKNAVKKTEQTFKGNWVLESITYDGNGEFTSTLFQDSEASCFIGSSWYFVANNNRGTYDFNNSSCSSNQRKFIWTIPGSKESINETLLLKITDDNYRSATNDGFELKITNLSEYNMTLSIPSSVNGQIVYVNLNFTKTIIV